MALKQLQATKPPTSTDATDSGSVEHWQFYDGEARDQPKKRTETNCSEETTVTVY